MRIEVERYDREGVLFPIPVLTADEVAYFRACVEDLEGRMGGRPKPSDLMQPHLFYRWAYDLAVHPAVLDAVEQLLGPDILVHSVSIFSKHSHTDDYVSWHQDGHYWGLDVPRLTSAWIALTPSNAENGCLRVVPRSHGEARLPHVDRPYSRDNLLASGLEVAVDVADSETLDVVLAPGEMSLHHVNLVHGSNANRSGEKRIGVAVRYVAPEVRQALEHHPVVLARGRDVYRHYTMLESPPSAPVEEGLQAHVAFTRRLLESRLGVAGDRER
jgi:ectoine hydroxylase-related dioxygenase (phytanoyl-CoA dioxygenase family)